MQLLLRAASGWEAWRQALRHITFFLTQSCFWPFLEGREIKKNILPHPAGVTVIRYWAFREVGVNGFLSAVNSSGNPRWEPLAWLVPSVFSSSHSFRLRVFRYWVSGSRTGSPLVQGQMAHDLSLTVTTCGLWEIYISASSLVDVPFIQQYSKQNSMETKLSSILKGLCTMNLKNHPQEWRVGRACKIHRYSPNRIKDKNSQPS